jgi:hypothetical protein
MHQSLVQQGTKDVENDPLVHLAHVPLVIQTNIACWLEHDAFVALGGSGPPVPSGF